MVNRIEILTASLKKKEAMFDQKLQEHFDTVRQANGQPLNDKRNGRSTLDKWDRQNESLRSMQESIGRTKAAIEREQKKISVANSINIPTYIQDAIDDGLLTQWRKFPRFFFVNGVEHGRIVLDEKTGAITHRYLSKVSKEHYPLFRDVFNSINKKIRDMNN